MSDSELPATMTIEEQTRSLADERSPEIFVVKEVSPKNDDNDDNKDLDHVNESNLLKEDHDNVQKEDNGKVNGIKTPKENNGKNRARSRTRSRTRSPSPATISASKRNKSRERDRDSKRSRSREKDKNSRPSSRSDNRDRESRRRSPSRSRSREKERNKSRRSDKDRDRDRERGSKSRRGRSRSGSRHRSSRSRSRQRRREERERSRERERERERKRPETHQDKIRKFLDRMTETERDSYEKERPLLSVRCSLLPLQASRRDLIEHFHTNDCGLVRDAQIVMDKRSKSKGYAYVEFLTKESVERAIMLSGVKMLGKKILIERSEAEKMLQAEKSSMQMALEEETAKAAAAALGEAGGEGVQGANAAAATVNKLKGNRFSSFTESNGEPTRLYLAHLAPTLDQTGIKLLFGNFGEVTRVQLLTDRNTNKYNCTAYIVFKEHESAKKALSLNGTDMGSTLPLSVAWAMTPDERKQIALERRAQMISSQQLQLQQQAQALGGLMAITPMGAAIQQQLQLQQLQLQQLQLQQQQSANAVASAISGMTTLPVGFPVPVLPTNGHSLTTPGSVLPLPHSISATADPSLKDDLTTTCAMVLKNMFDPPLNTEELAELVLDVREECENFGQVKHCMVVNEGPGAVYVRFAQTQQVLECLEAMDGREFDGKEVVAELVGLTTYMLMFPTDN